MSLPVFSQAPLNWTRDEVNPGEDFILVYDEIKFTEGQRSCHMQLHSGAVPYLVSDVYYILPGAAYEFSIDVFDNDTAGQVKIYADFFDTYGFDIFGQDPVFSHDSAGWKTIAWQGTVPEMAVVGYVMIKFYCQPDLYIFNQTSEIWIDNISFKINGDTNLVTNGGFENWALETDELPGNTSRIIIYPNPARQFVNVILPKGMKEIILTDIAGNALINESAGENPILQMDVRSLQKGVYLIKGYRGDGMTVTQKLIVY